MSLPGPKAPEERRMNSAVALLLRVGLITSLGLLLAGLVLVATGTGAPVPPTVSLGGLPGALLRLEPGGYFSLGLLVLVLTPAAQVLLLLAGFARAGRWLLAGCSLVILAALALSGVLGFAG